MRYPVVIHQEGDSAYGVTVPDIPGCFSAGDTIDEAMDNASEAILAHLELVTEGGGEIEDASPIEEHKANKDYAGGVWAFVDADIEDLMGPAERINVTIPKRALKKIDVAVKEFGDNRSALLTRAALDYIKGSHGMVTLIGGKELPAAAKKMISEKVRVSEGSRTYQTNPTKQRAKHAAAAKRKA